MPENHGSIPPGADAKARLDEILRSNRAIKYFVDIPDKEYPFVTCSIYGAPKSNELFVKLSNGRLSFVDFIPSRVEFPPMGDRIFGLDVADHADAFGLADQLWERNRADLILRCAADAAD